MTEAVLTPHPLQRVGAYALARLAGTKQPQAIDAAALQKAVDGMTRDAVTAALGRDTKVPEGFWLKCSLSLFPNSPMNHPSNGKKTDATISEAVARWRTRPTGEKAPEAPCVLCGRPAARFYGKVDVPLAESDIYRNSTPRGHEGMALCWPCVCSFHALPYGCHLTGGPSFALHSWDEKFLAFSVRRQVNVNQRQILIGRGVPRQPPSREALALQVLRNYRATLDAGVELIVFSNNNRGQTLETYALDQPLAEWLRNTMTGGTHQGTFPALLRAHQAKGRPGIVALARNAFRDPPRVVSACGRHLASAAVAGLLRPETPQLTALCFSYATEVLDMDDSSLKEIRATAARVAALLAQKTGSGGDLRAFYATFKQPAALRTWLRRRALDWLLTPPKDAPDTETPMVTTRGYELLFDPALDSQAWFHREIFLIAVLEELHGRGWRPDDAAKVAAQLRDDEPDPVDQEFLAGKNDNEDEEEQR